MILAQDKVKTVSYCIFTYNQEAYVEEAINSVLNQNYTPLEIIISDDCSTDNTFNVIERNINKYSGHHKIILNRNNKNLGIGAHFSKVYYSIATGDYLIGLGGDDSAKVNHAAYAFRKMEENQEVNLIDFNAVIINEKGEYKKNIDLNFDSKFFSLDDYLKLGSIQSFAPGRIIRRELLNRFNPISKNCPTEDSVLVLRSLLTGGFIRFNEALIYYRKHEANISSSIGLSRMSNHAIYSQYMKDLLHYYDKGFVDDILLDRLIKRLNYELENRKLKYSIASDNRFLRIKKELEIKLLEQKYKLNLI